MSKLIVVVGATGIQGGSVARTFLQIPEWRVRGIARDPSGEAAQSLAKAGVEIVKGDLDDKQSLIRAFDGANAIFSNTNFFAHLIHGLNPANLPLNRTPFEYAFDREVEQGLNVAEAAECPSVLKSLERIVFSSLGNATHLSGGKYKRVYHFDAKAEAIRLTKERFPGVSERMSTVRFGHYVTNWKTFPKIAPRKQSDGSYLLSRNTPSTFKMALFVAHSDTGPFVKALIDMPPNKDLLAVSQYMTFPDWMEIWGRVHGVKAEYKEISREELFEGVPEPFAAMLGDDWDFIRDFGNTGGDPSVLSPEQLDFNIPTTSMEEYIKSEDWSAVM